MGEKESEELIDKNCNDDWCAALEIFWKETLFTEGSRLNLIIERLRLAVVPIAILPFDKKYLYAQYIALPKNANELRDKKFTLLVKKKRPDEKKYNEIPLAKGIFDSICIDNPYIWNKYLPLRKDAKNVQPIDKRTKEYEEKLFSSLVDGNEEDEKGKEREGQFIIPLFFGIFPVYCLMIVSNTITPKVFNARYLRETFDMIGRIGESILADGFISPLWESFCDKYKDEYATNSDKRKQLFDTLEFRLSGKHIEKMMFSSWIHSLPGHTVDDNDSLNKTTEVFKKKNRKIKARLISDEKWYENFLKRIMIDKKVNSDKGLFGIIHDVIDESDLKEVKDNARLLDRAHECLWIKNNLDLIEADENPFNEKKKAFYKLKTVLNKVAFQKQKERSISAGFVYLWPEICEMKNYGVNLDFEEHNIALYNLSKEIYFDPFDFVKVFYSFIKEFNREEYRVSNSCRIQNINISGGKDSRGFYKDILIKLELLGTNCEEVIKSLEKSENNHNSSDKSEIDIAKKHTSSLYNKLRLEFQIDLKYCDKEIKLII